MARVKVICALHKISVTFPPETRPFSSETESLSYPAALTPSCCWCRHSGLRKGEVRYTFQRSCSPKLVEDISHSGFGSGSEVILGWQHCQCHCCQACWLPAASRTAAQPPLRSHSYLKGGCTQEGVGLSSHVTSNGTRENGL